MSGDTKNTLMMAVWVVHVDEVPPMVASHRNFSGDKIFKLAIQCHVVRSPDQK